MFVTSGADYVRRAQVPLRAGVLHLLNVSTGNILIKWRPNSETDRSSTLGYRSGPCEGKVVSRPCKDLR